MTSTNPNPHPVVVDASIGGSAGMTDAIASAKCREHLEDVLSSSVSIVLTAELRAEWEMHNSRYASKWLKTMGVRRRIIDAKPRKRRCVVSNRLERLCKGTEFERAVTKDLHLIQAAEFHDATISSLDEKMRNNVVRYCGRVAGLRKVTWLNPVVGAHDLRRWLANGANPADLPRLC